MLLLPCDHDWQSCCKDQRRCNTCILQPSHLSETTCDETGGCCSRVAGCVPNVGLSDYPGSLSNRVCAWDVWSQAQHTTLPAPAGACHRATMSLGVYPVCMSPIASEQLLKMTWTSCVCSDNWCISCSVSRVILLRCESTFSRDCAGAKSRRKGGEGLFCPMRATGLLRWAPRGQWWFAFQVWLPWAYGDGWGRLMLQRSGSLLLLISFCVPLTLPEEMLAGGRVGRTPPIALCCVLRACVV